LEEYFSYLNILFPQIINNNFEYLKYTISNLKFTLKFGRNSQFFSHSKLHERVRKRQNDRSGEKKRKERKRKEKKTKEKKEGREMHNFVSNISPVSLTASNVIPALQQKTF
jgi:hypothetical protein